MILFQLGVSEIEDITSVLGDDSTSSKAIKDDDNEAGSSKKLQTESLFYKDSTLFLKVCLWPFLSLKKGTAKGTELI